MTNAQNNNYLRTVAYISEQSGITLVPFGHLVARVLQQVVCFFSLIRFIIQVIFSKR